MARACRVAFGVVRISQEEGFWAAGFPELRAPRLRALPSCGPPELRASLPMAPAADAFVEMRLCLLWLLRQAPRLVARFASRGSWGSPGVEHLAEVQALEGGDALSRFRLACWMRSAECAASRFQLARWTRPPNARSFSISGCRGQNRPICESPRLSAGFSRVARKRKPRSQIGGNASRASCRLASLAYRPILSTAARFS